MFGKYSHNSLIRQTFFIFFFLLFYNKHYTIFIINVLQNMLFIYPLLIPDVHR